MEKSPLPPTLEKAIQILKWLNANLQLGEKSLQYIERKMREEFQRSNWDQTELTNHRMTMYCIVSNMAINYVAFKDEYKKGFGAAAKSFDKERYISINRACQPYFDVIDEIFPDLKNIRNIILAHGFRLKDGTAQSDPEIDRLMNQLTNRGSLHPYYSLSNNATHVLSEIEKELGEVNAELNLEEGWNAEFN